MHQPPSRPSLGTRCGRHTPPRRVAPGSRPRQRRRIHPRRRHTYNNSAPCRCAQIRIVRRHCRRHRHSRRAYRHPYMHTPRRRRHHRDVCLVASVPLCLLPLRIRLTAPRVDTHPTVSQIAPAHVRAQRHEHHRRIHTRIYTRLHLLLHLPEPHRRGRRQGRQNHARRLHTPQRQSPVARLVHTARLCPLSPHRQSR